MPRLVGSSGGVHGVAWSSGFGPRGAAAAAGRQRSHLGPAAETHSSTAGSRRKRRRRQSMGKQIPVRTYNDWDRPPPGFLEIDLVAHCGGPLSGSFIHSLVATDIGTGWPAHAQSGPFPSWSGNNPWWWPGWKPSVNSCHSPSATSTRTNAECVTTARSSTRR